MCFPGFSMSSLSVALQKKSKTNPFMLNSRFFSSKLKKKEKGVGESSFGDIKHLRMTSTILFEAAQLWSVYMLSSSQESTVISLDCQGSDLTYSAWLATLGGFGGIFCLFPPSFAIIACLSHSLYTSLKFLQLPTAPSVPPPFIYCNAR